MRSRRMLVQLVILLLAPAALRAQGRGELNPRRPVSTYSIVARDPPTGDMGVAVQSHWFSVGAIVPWAEAGVGAVATQSFVEAVVRAAGPGPHAHGPLGARGAEGAGLHRRAPRRCARWRMVDAHGTWPPSPARGPSTPPGTTWGRLLDPGQPDGEPHGAGTRWRGPTRPPGRPGRAAAGGAGGGARRREATSGAGSRRPSSWCTGRPPGSRGQDRQFDLRVEDNPAPVAELGRLVRLQRAYNALNEGDGMVTLASIGREDDAVPYLLRAQAQDSRWAELVGRLPVAWLLPSEEVADRLRHAMEGSRWDRWPLAD